MFDVGGPKSSVENNLRTSPRQLMLYAGGARVPRRQGSIKNKLRCGSRSEQPTPRVDVCQRVHPERSLVQTASPTDATIQGLHLAYDVTLVICMLNGIKKVDLNRFCETSDAAQETRSVCLHLRRLKRSMLMIGGTADLWACSPEWGSMFNTAGIIACHLGVTTTG